ncbi:hypothetical protein [Streptomyces paludis]|uniref:GNAT family N-acetyltransferase n=1 Tax=Streptomyces paludis TaxID=2282738 RepID=A0A345HQS2_9ACTN|nr:hypothetical protein [Streptomyces paludis]AXG79046.1 hypothetical protein DVK44_16625 [Streptomyces paludis]
MTVMLLYTHAAPRYRSDHLGRLMTWAISDRVARLHPEVQWIRCLVRSRAVMELFRDRDGWEPVRTTQDSTFATVHLMQRRPEAKDGLRALIASPALQART